MGGRRACQGYHTRVPINTVVKLTVFDNCYEEREVTPRVPPEDGRIFLWPWGDQTEFSKEQTKYHKNNNNEYVVFTVPVE